MQTGDMGKDDQMNQAMVVFLHGAASSVKTWHPTMAALPSQRMIALPLLGHADQPRRQNYPLVAFRDHVLTQLKPLGNVRLVLVGHSLGAFVATLVAQQWPSRVERLVLEEPPVPRREAHDDPPFTPASHWKMTLASPLVRSRMDPRALRQVLNELNTPMPAWWTALSSVPAPILILAGGPTSHLDQSRFTAMARELPRGEVRTILAGHRIHTKYHQEYLRTTLPFLTDQP